MIWGYGQATWQTLELNYHLVLEEHGPNPQKSHIPKNWHNDQGASELYCEIAVLIKRHGTQNSNKPYISLEKMLKSLKHPLGT